MQEMIWAGRGYERETLTIHTMNQ